MEVERERVHLSVAEGITAVRTATDGGQHVGVAGILNARLKGGGVVSAEGGRGRPDCQAIKEELRDFSFRVGDRMELLADGARVPTCRHELARATAGVWGGAAGFGGEGYCHF
jgi:hypothetical protein